MCARLADDVENEIGTEPRSIAMKAATCRQLIALLLMFVIVTVATAQQDPISELKRGIQELEAIERDPSTSPEVRKINHDFLTQRRRELRAALQKAVEDLENYKSRVSLSATEKQALANTITARKDEITTLDALLAGAGIPASAQETRPQNAPVTPIVSSPDVAAPRPSRTDSRLSAHGPTQTTCDYPDVPDAIKSDVDKVADDIVDRNDVARIGNISQRAIFFTVTDALTRAEPVKASALKAYTYIGETTRTDKQIGTTAASGGSTSAIEKPGWSDLLGFAVERGAIQQDVSDTTLTLSTTPYAFLIPSQDDTAETNRRYGYLKRLGLSASFNVSDKDKILANASRKNLQQYAAKLRITSDHGPNTEEFDAEWNTLIKPAIQGYLNTLSGGVESLFGQNVDLQEYRNSINTTVAADIQKVLTDTNASMASMNDTQKAAAIAAAKAKVSSIVLCALKTKVFDEVKSDGSGKIKVDKTTADHIAGSVLPRLIAARARLDEAKELYQQMLKDFEKKPEASLSFTNIRPDIGTQYGVFNFLYQRYLGASPVKMTFNAGSSFYHGPNPKLNQSTFRDFITSLSLTGSRNSPFQTAEVDLSQLTYSFTARYQRIQENRHLANRKADLAVVQFKLEVPIAKGFSVPLSLTYANATELNKEKTVRGNFGITFDFDKFMAVKRILSMIGNR
jgi:hypothetical protein